jgi:F-type H+/Na+-transporting ATPase subunit alpha
LTELLKQPQYSPMSVWEQTAILLAATEGCFDAIPVEQIKPAQAALLNTLKQEDKKAMDKLNQGDKPTDETKDLILAKAKLVAKEYQS